MAFMSLMETELTPSRSSLCASRALRGTPRRHNSFTPAAHGQSQTYSSTAHLCLHRRKMHSSVNLTVAGLSSRYKYLHLLNQVINTFSALIFIMFRPRQLPIP